MTYINLKLTSEELFTVKLALSESAFNNSRDGYKVAAEDSTNVFHCILGQEENQINVIKADEINKRMKAAAPRKKKGSNNA